MHLSETDSLKDQVAILKDSGIFLRKDLEEATLQAFFNHRPDVSHSHFFAARRVGRGQ